MHLPTQLAKHFRDAYFGGNWTSVNLKDTVQDISWQEATAKIHDGNSIATLIFHTGYYVTAVLQVLEGGTLQASDKYSFDVPPIHSTEDWQGLLDKTWSEGERFAVLDSTLPEEHLWKDLADPN